MSNVNAQTSTVYTLLHSQWDLGLSGWMGLMWLSCFLATVALGDVLNPANSHITHCNQSRDFRIRTAAASHTTVTLEFTRDSAIPILLSREWQQSAMRTRNPEMTLSYTEMSYKLTVLLIANTQPDQTLGNGNESRISFATSSTVMSSPNSSVSQSMCGTLYYSTSTVTSAYIYTSCTHYAVFLQSLRKALKSQPH